uniref:PNT domain-containing protein n=1 Tax=Parascaris equorum TaxID=6256 RepID=A0A914S5P7_PAREQ
MTNVIKKRVKLESDSMASPRCRPRIEMSEGPEDIILRFFQNPRRTPEFLGVWKKIYINSCEIVAAGGGAAPAIQLEVRKTMMLRAVSDVHQQPLTSTANPLLSLTPGTKSKFADILKHSYSKFDIQRQQSNIPADPTLWTLAQTSAWIDWARKEFNVVDRCDQ